MSDHNAHGSAAKADHVEHPTWKQYKWVAFWLTLITAIEVWIYYTPFKDSAAFAPKLMGMSAFKFGVVVFYYMHLKYDHAIFRRLFAMGLGIALFTIMALLFLFHKISV